MPGNKTQTQQTSSEPWGPAQGALKTGLKDAQSLYSKGVGSQPYTGSTVVPFAKQTMQGMNRNMWGANFAAPEMTNNFQQVANNAQNGGLNALQQGAVNQLKPMSQGNPAEGLGQLNDMQRGAYGQLKWMGTQPVKEGTAQFNDVQRGAYGQLNKIAGGSEMQGNPYLDDVINRSAEDIGKSGNLMASAAGRYGSGGHQGVIADQVGDMSSGLRFADYGNQQNRRDAAIRDVFGMGNQANAQSEADWARRQYGISGMASMGDQANNQYESDMARKMDATGSLFNAGQQQQNNINSNTGALMGAYQGMLAPSETMMGVGGMYEDLQGRTMNDQMRLFSETQNAPWNQIARLNAVASGAGSMGSSGQTVAQGPSRLGSGIGGAMAGYGMGGPLGGILGGLGGAYL